MNSSISRQLILWLAVPLMLMALCSALVHYLNNVAPAMISNDRRLKDAANAFMAHTQVVDGRWSLAHADGPPAMPAPDSAVYAVRDPQGRLLLGDDRLPVVALNSDTSQSFAMSQFGKRYVRTLSTRFDGPGGSVIMTVADTRAAAEPAARLGLMSTLLWDFVQ
jgi:hypothetical protein